MLVTLNVILSVVVKAVAVTLFVAREPLKDEPAAASLMVVF